MRAFAVFLALAFVAVTALPARAANGIQYDEITKMIMDGSTPAVGTFQQDYATISSRPAPPHAGPGMNPMMAMMGQNPMAMFSQGMLTRVAYLGPWYRVDDVANQTAVITKCDSSQIITLNLAAKTYRITDLNAPVPHMGGYGGHGGPPPPEMDPGSTRITMKTTALGSKTLDDTQTDGYNETVDITTQKDGDTRTSHFDGSTWYGPMSTPHATCHAVPAAAGLFAGLSGMASMIHNFTAGDRFKVDVSGPTPPFSRFPLYAVYNFRGDRGQGRAMTVEIESGHVKSLGDADKALFEVPAGFTREN